MAAYRWVLYVRQLTPLAIHDFDMDRESIDDAWADLRSKSHQQTEMLRRKQLRRAETRLAEGRAKQAEVRRALLLEDDPDGEPD